MTHAQVITRESAEADKVKQVVSREEAAASEEAAKVKAIKDDCEADLAHAMPLLEAALKVGVGLHGPAGVVCTCAIIEIQPTPGVGEGHSSTTRGL
jgi:hypothetical protein